MPDSSRDSCRCQQIGHIENLSKNLQKYENSKLSSLGMRGIHALTLFQLSRRSDGMTVTEIATACEVDKALISRVVVELIEAGHVVYLEPETKNYRRKIVLTPRGRACLRRVTLLICSSIRDIKDEITVEELNAFFKVMMALNAVFSGEIAAEDSNEEKGE